MPKIDNKRAISNINKRVSNIKSRYSQLQREVLFDIPQAALNVAQTQLALATEQPDFTQKHGVELVNEIGLTKIKQQRNGTYIRTLKAPLSDAPEIAYEMYFAEYGAGLGKDSALAKPSIPTTYERTGGDMLAQKGIYPYKNDGYWYYPLLYPLMYTDKLGRTRTKNYAKTNTSVAVNYMYTARKWARKAIKAACKNARSTKAKLATSIKR